MVTRATRICGKPALFVPLLSFTASLLPIAFTGQRRLHAALLSWLQIKGVSFDLLDDVFSHYLPLEAAERVLQRLAFLQPYLSQLPPPTLTTISIHCCAFAAELDFAIFI